MNELKNELKTRCLTDGTGSLTEREKLLLLMCFSERGEGAVRAADRLYSAYGSFRSAADSDPDFLMKECGISAASAALLTLFPQLSRRCAITSCGNIRLDCAEAAKRFFSAQLRSARSETLIAAATDERFRIIGAERTGTGTGSAVNISNRRIADFALRHNAAYVFIAHNHTAGAPLPSQNDKSATLKLGTALIALDVLLVDHIITGADGSAMSMRESSRAEYFPAVSGYKFERQPL